MAAASLFALASAASAATPPFANFTQISDVFNFTNPGVWEHHTLDVTGLVAGAANAQLSFDLANDLPGTNSASTGHKANSHLYFASSGAAYYMNFEFFWPASEPLSNSSVHFRDVRLVIDGSLLRDQYGAFSNHLGDPLLGTAGDGDSVGSNILGQGDFEARTYALTAAVPEPETYALMLTGLGVMGALMRGRKRTAG